MPAGVLFLMDPARNRRESLRLNPDTRSETELLRACPAATGCEVGDCSIMLDLDLACPGGGPGDGVPSITLPLPKGLLRHRGPLCACALILVYYVRL